MLSCTVSCTRQKRFLRFLVDGKEPGGPSRTSGVRTWGDASPPILVGSVCRGGTQGSLGTFVFTGAVQPSTHCMVDFPPPRCIRRKLLSADGSSLFIPPRALDWEESRGGNKPKQEGIKLIPPLCSCPPPVPLNWKKKALLATSSQVVHGEGQKGRRTSPGFHLLTPPWVCSMG